MDGGFITGADKIQECERGAASAHSSSGQVALRPSRLILEIGESVEDSVGVSRGCFLFSTVSADVHCDAPRLLISRVSLRKPPPHLPLPLPIGLYLV